MRERSPSKAKLGYAAPEREYAFCVNAPYPCAELPCAFCEIEICGFLGGPRDWVHAVAMREKIPQFAVQVCRFLGVFRAGFWSSPGFVEPDYAALPRAY